MVSDNQTICPLCGGELQYYDKVFRKIRCKFKKIKKIQMNRVKCKKCGKIHRVFPDFILPYKQYEADIVKGVLDGIITPETLGFEDYPCEATMNRWLKEKGDSE